MTGNSGLLGLGAGVDPGILNPDMVPKVELRADGAVGAVVDDGAAAGTDPPANGATVPETERE
jgi:hypothetical protein